MKKLVVWWKHYSMSKDVAKKAQCQGGKTYVIEPRRSEFPVDKDPQEAIDEIMNEHGRRPEINPARGAHVKHAFAEIIVYRITDLVEPTKVEAEEYEEGSLL